MTCNGIWYEFIVLVISEPRHSSCSSFKMLFFCIIDPNKWHVVLSELIQCNGCLVSTVMACAMSLWLLWWPPIVTTIFLLYFNCVYFHYYGKKIYCYWYLRTKTSISTVLGLYLCVSSWLCVNTLRFDWNSSYKVEGIFKYKLWWNLLYFDLNFSEVYQIEINNSLLTHT